MMDEKKCSIFSNQTFKEGNLQYYPSHLVCENT
jgi:hypothetical protein